MTLLIAIHFAMACQAPLLLRLLRGRADFLLALASTLAFGGTVGAVGIP